MTIMLLNVSVTKKTAQDSFIFDTIASENNTLLSQSSSLSIYLLVNARVETEFSAMLTRLAPPCYVIRIIRKVIMQIAFQHIKGMKIQTLHSCVTSLPVERLMFSTVTRTLNKY